MEHKIFINFHDSPEDSLTSAIIISMEVGCGYSSGSFYEPFSLLPENEEQKNIAIKMLEDQGIKYST
tara:strand:+ start:216 stop:416 length:201 start_codon:yes stop_codon:yes gene_type:complete